MIENDKQLQITINWIGTFADIVSNLTKQELPTTTNDKLRYLIYLRSNISMIDDFLDQVKEYWNENHNTTNDNWNINLDKEQLVEIEKDLEHYYNKDVIVMKQELNLRNITIHIQKSSDSEIRSELLFTLIDQLHPTYENNVELQEIIDLIEDRKINVSDIMEQLFEWCSNNNVSYVM